MIGNVSALPDPSSMSVLGGVSGQRPETGELDFLKSLLGLQDSLNVSSEPLTPLNELNAEGVATQEEKEDPNDLLAGLASQMTRMTDALSPPVSQESEREQSVLASDLLTSQITSPHKGESLAGQDLKALESGPKEPSNAIDSDAEAPDAALAAGQSEAPLGLSTEQKKAKEAAGESYADMVKQIQREQRSEISDSSREGQALSDFTMTSNTEAPLSESTERTNDPNSGSSEAKAEPSPFQVVSTSMEKIAEAEVNTNAVRNERESRSVTPNELFKGVESLINQGGGRMTVVLDPPELGRVEVQVQARGNRVEIGLRSELEQTRALLENGLGDLKQSLQNQDLILSKIEFQVGKELGQNTQNMSFGSGMWNGSTSSQHSQGFQFSQGAQRSYRSNHSQPGMQLPSVAAVQTASSARIAGSGRVDIRI